jgi:hypothetical protein
MRISIFGSVFAPTRFSIPSPRVSGERGTLLAMNLPSRRKPPLPVPLLHKSVEERGKTKLNKNGDARQSRYVW